MKQFFGIVVACLIGISLSAQEIDSTEVSPIELNEVIVTGARYSTTSRYVPMTVSTVSHDALAATERVNMLPTISEQVPGLFVTQRGVMGFGVSGGAVGGINVRGMSSGVGQLLVLIDGQPQFQGIFGHSIADSYQTMMADRVEVVRGPASVLYGSNAMGGVVNIVTRQQKEDGVHTNVHVGYGSYNTFQAEANNQLRVKNFYSTVAAQYSRSDNHRPRMGFEQFGGMLKLGYDISDHWQINGQADVTHFNSSYPGSVDKPLYEADQSITRGVASVWVANDYNKTNGRLSVYDNFGFHTINDGYSEGQAPQTELFKSEDHLLGVCWYQTFSAFVGSHITVGADYLHIYGHAYYVSRETGEVVTAGKRGMQSTNSNVDEIAVYADVRQDIAQWLTLNAGVRYDYHSVAGGEWVPEAGIVVRPMKNGELKAVVSKGFRNPTVKDMFLYAVANHDSLRAERLWNYELSWHHRAADGKLSYGANVYYMKGDNLIQTVAGRNVNTGKIENIGAELEMNYHINQHWVLTTNHSYIHQWHAVVGTPQYKGYLGVDMHYGKWKLNVGVQQLAGLYTEATAQQTTTENATLLGAKLSYQPLKQVALWVRGDNLLAQKYEINKGYPMPRATVMLGMNVSF